jgi:hypothetical protein
MQQQYLNIGNIGFLVWSAHTEICFDEGYFRFINPRENHADISIEVIPRIPEDFCNTLEPIFDSHDGVDLLWRVYAHDDGYVVQTFNPQHIHATLSLLHISSDTHAWKVYTQAFDNKTYPFAYPNGPLLLYYATCVLPRIMIHASGIVDGQTGRLFTGFSGVGKSTMAGYWQQAGHQVINDDRLMLSIEERTIYIYNTPMFYRDTPKKQELHAIYLLKQTPEHTIQQLHGIDAVSRVLAFCIQHSYNKDWMQHHIQMVLEICSAVRVYVLGVAVQQGVLDFIREYD